MPKKQIDKIKQEFIKYLDSLGISSKSHKNYRSDLTHFTSWAILKIRSFGSFAESLSETIPFLGKELALDYKNYMAKNSTPSKTINRRLSTLRHLSRFLTSTQFIDADFMEGVENILAGGGSARKKPQENSAINEFKAFLEAEKISPNTIKNYLSDIKQFMSWLEDNRAQIVNSK